MPVRPINNRRKRYPLAPVRPWGVVLWLWLPLLAAAGSVAGAHLDALRSGQLAPWLQISLLLVIALACALLHARRSIALQDRELVLHATLLTRRVPITAMRLDAARVVDLAEHTEFKPGRKKFAFGYPGFYAGYYQTRHGQPAFYLLTDDSHRVLALPLRDGRWLVLSPEQPRNLLEDLQRLAAVPA